jgi:hypothetical protein
MTAAVAVSGATYWHDLVSQRQARLEKYDRIDEQLGSLIKQHPGAPILLVGSPSDWKNSNFGAEAQYIHGRTIFEHGVRAAYCKPPQCRPARDPRVLEQPVGFYQHKWITVRPPSIGLP